jgi:hypothetical protein
VRRKADAIALPDPRLAKAILDVVDRRVTDALRGLPVEQYGIVAAVDPVAGRASVYLDGSDVPSPGWVYGVSAPSAGDRVLVRRTTGGDRLLRQNLSAASGGGLATPAAHVDPASATPEDIVNAMIAAGMMEP